MEGHRWHTGLSQLCVSPVLLEMLWGEQRRACSSPRDQVTLCFSPSSDLRLSEQPKPGVYIIRQDKNVLWARI